MTLQRTTLALLEHSNGGLWCARYFEMVGPHAVSTGEHRGSWADVRAVVLEVLSTSQRAESAQKSGGPAC